MYLLANVKVNIHVFAIHVCSSLESAILSM